jgi:short-subunit dehydrogenase
LCHNGRHHCDLSTIEGITKLVNEAKEFKVDTLINNVAITCSGKDFGQYTSEEIQNYISVNLTSPILLSYHLMKQLKTIININSMVGLEIKPFRTMYSATKWGLRGFSQSLKAENKDIFISDVYPTKIQTKPDIDNALDIDLVINTIYTDGFINHLDRIILDGRPNKK